MNEHSDFVYNMSSSRGLRWSPEEINHVINNRLDENFRNHPDISEFTMYSWKIGRQKIISLNQTRKKISFEEMVSNLKVITKQNLHNLGH